MAGSLTDLLAGNNQAPTQGVSISNEIKGGVQAGVQLATAQEQVESSKVKLEEQKAELVMKQATTANSLLTNLARANPAVAKMMVKQVREKLLNLGVDPEIANYTISDDANRQRQIAFSQMAGGKLTQDKELAGEYFQNLASVVGYDQAAQQFSNELKNQQDNSKQQVANTQQTKIEQMGNDSAERIAALGMDKIDRREDMVLGKEKRAEAKQLDNDFANVDSALKDIDDAEKALKAYSKNTTAGTGPIATGFGLKKFGSEETERLDAKLKKLSLDSMVKMFAGMSKAVDTGAERRAFEATQSGITLDDKTNLDILAKQKQALLATKKKILNAKKGIGAIEAAGQTAATPNPKEPPNAAKAQAALERAKAAQAGK